MYVYVPIVGGLQPFPPINIAPDINPDMAPPSAKKVRSETEDLIPEQQFIAEHPVRVKLLSRISAEVILHVYTYLSIV